MWFCLKHKPVISITGHRAKKLISWGSEKRTSKSKNLMERSPFHASSIGLKTCPHLGSEVSCQKKKVAALHTKLSDSSCCVRLMMMGVTCADKQLDQMAQAIEKLTKTIEEKDMQITLLISKLEERHARKSSEDAPYMEKEASQEFTPARMSSQCMIPL